MEHNQKLPFLLCKANVENGEVSKKTPQFIRWMQAYSVWSWPVSLDQSVQAEIANSKYHGTRRMYPALSKHRRIYRGHSYIQQQPVWYLEINLWEAVTAASRLRYLTAHTNPAHPKRTHSSQPSRMLFHVPGIWFAEQKYKGLEIIIIWGGTSTGSPRKNHNQ